ncbi:MAG: hypothetical protein HZB55_06795 [Deltaproteobacteria bacterium]|nr:hypothetical protein [Deltaproteobacteria bacterium]
MRLLFLLAAGVLAAGIAGAAWPPGLEAAADAYRRTLNASEEPIRNGTLAAPRGIEEALQFDRETHGCHRGPAHAYRDYGAPEPPAPSPKSPKAAGKMAAVRVRYPYRVFYRQALTLEALFEKPWKEGSEGAVEVEFRRTERGWEPGLKSERLGDPTKSSKPGVGPGRGIDRRGNGPSGEGGAR